MPERTCGINTVADRRYYHFVVVSGKGMSLATYWKRLNDMGEIERPKMAVPVESPRFTLEHRKFRSERAYARGAAAQTLSEKGNGRPPFLYDLFAARIEFEDNLYLILGFPFAALALESVDYLADQGFLKNGEFQGADLSKLLSEKNRPLQRFDGLTSSVVGVQFIVTDDKSLTAVRLGGDDPFQAQIYESFLKKKFEQGLWVPDQCVLACERETETPQRERLKSSGRILRSRLHIDKSGNFKFYMHAGCSNVALMPYAIAQISAVACLRDVFGNPLRRIEQDEVI
jgi:hypothetical protein